MIDKKQILDAFHFRHACKTFDPEQKIPDDDFGLILEAGRLSPSSVGLEPWKFLIIQDPALRKIFHEHIGGSRTAAGQIPSCSHFMIVLARKNIQHDSTYVAHLMRHVHQFPEDIISLRTALLKNHQTVDFNLLGSERHLSDWAGKQTYIALGNMMTVAAMMEIDSCPLEGFNKAELNHILAEKCQVDLTLFDVAYGLTFGYRNTEPRPKTRQTIKAISEWFV